MSMISDNFCSTKLSLCLGNNSDDPKNKTSQSSDLDLDLDQLLIPSLTLGLSIFPAIKKLNHHDVISEDDNYYSRNMKGRGSNSSFSNGGAASSSVKKERRDHVCRSFEDVHEINHVCRSFEDVHEINHVCRSFEDVHEINHVCRSFEDVHEINHRDCPPKVIIADKLLDQYEDCPPRKKLRMTKDQSLVLEQSFMEHNTLYHKEKEALADMLNLKPRQVEVWFQNRRARTKLKQTEIESEMLKKCCESLKEENTRLLKELQDLKSSIFYMHLPAAAAATATTTTTTLNICSSCQRFGGAANDTSGENPSKISFSMGTSRSRFHRPIVNPFAACW